MNQNVIGANDRIRLGFIGVANRGGQLMSAFLKHEDMEIAALCDVSKSTLEKANARLSGKAATYGDFREMIGRDDIDAVVIATPDHWHAIQTIAACDAGKDVYVEKPLSITVHEGRRMVEAARRNDRVVTVGLHRRSSSLYAGAAQLVGSGGLGKVTVCRAYHRSNMFPLGIGRAEPTDPPPDLDWDMWLGPRPAEPYRATIAPYKFRWWMLYSSQTANNGVHFLDAMRWMTGDVAPTSISAIGGRYAVDDDRTIPDTLRVTFEFPAGRLFVFGMFETSGNRTLARGGYFEIRGTQGSMYCSDQSYEVVPERGGQFQDREPRMDPIEVKSSEGNITAQHARNFLDCIRSREKPNADVEEGHRSTTMSLLAKISWLTRSRLEWDAEKEQITNNEEANSLLHYEYRKPWKLG
ncbi:MAG: Gfo/Idh/MocA family oxidoreductase [Planctomycetota bacterium]